MLAPRVSTGFGSNIPGLQTPSYGNLVFPQAGTLPIRRRGLGEYQAGETIDVLPESTSGAADAPVAVQGAAAPDGPLPPVVFSTTVTDTWIPWELLLFGGALILLMDSKKGRRHAR